MTDSIEVVVPHMFAGDEDASRLIEAVIIQAVQRWGDIPLDAITMAAPRMTLGPDGAASLRVTVTRRPSGTVTCPTCAGQGTVEL
ncbi:MAG: hypothetical protein RLZ55_165 [Actinomycetota bacterium]|jgi:hypothetical protein